MTPFQQETAGQRPAVLRAALYDRVSDDRKGASKSNDQQLSANELACRENGWQPTGRYSDPDFSASKYATRERPDWARLLADLDRGLFEVVVLWESSRGSRDMDNWPAFLTLCAKRKVLIHISSPQDSDTYDPRKPKDRKALLNEGTANEYSSAETSARVRRHMNATISAGLPVGTCPFGYKTQFDPDGNKSRVIHEEHAAIVRRIVREVGEGKPLSTLTDELVAEKAAGRKWARSVVRDTALNPAYVRARVHHDEEICPAAGHRHKGSCTVCPRYTNGQWPAIVTDAEHWAAVNRLTAPGRKTTRPGAEKWLLSYLATCGVCGRRMIGSNASGPSRPKPAYQCERGCVTIQVERIEEGIIEALCDALAGPEIYHLVMRRDEPAEAAAARSEAARLQGILDAWTDRIGTPAAMDDDELARLRARLKPEILALTERATTTKVPASVAKLMGEEPSTYAELRATFEALTIPQRKEILRWSGAVIVVVPLPAGSCTRDKSAQRFTFTQTLPKVA